MYLSGLCKTVTLIHRRDAFRASMAMQDRVRKNPKIKILYNTEVDEILDVSKGEVTGVRVAQQQEQRDRGPRRHRATSSPSATRRTRISSRTSSTLHDNGYLKTKPGSTATNIPGVFASGDVQDFVYRQAVTAAGTGCMAALEAERWLAANSEH